MKTFSSTEFKWHKNGGKAKLKDLGLKPKESFEVISVKTGRIKTFEYTNTNYYMPMGSDGMFEIAGYDYECGNYLIKISHPHDNGKPM